MQEYFARRRSLMWFAVAVLGAPTVVFGLRLASVRLRDVVRVEFPNPTPIPDGNPSPSPYGNSPNQDGT